MKRQSRTRDCGDEDRRNNRNVPRAAGISCREYLENQINQGADIWKKVCVNA